MRKNDIAQSGHPNRLVIDCTPIDASLLNCDEAYLESKPCILVREDVSSRSILGCAIAPMPGPTQVVALLKSLISSAPE